jgi:alpha-methylacyl-CoA racemase
MTVADGPPASRKGPLAGVRIVEIDAIGPVPLAATMLADMGAEIVRVARPPHPGAAWDDVGGSVVHRSRGVVHADLKSPGDREAVKSLAASAHALIEGYRPGVMERLGLGPETLLAVNPRLVYVRMTGWGQAGPLAPRAGHDINYIAIAGALHAIGPAEGPPAVPLNLVGDYGGGAMFAVAGLLAGLISARSTGKGQVVDAAMTDGIASLLSLFHAFMGSGLWQDRPAANLLDGAAPFYRCYRCSDGGHVAVGALEPQFFAQLLDGLGLEADRYVQNDRAGWPRMEADFAAVFASRARDEWARLFEDRDACVSPVLSLVEAVRHPHNRARGTYLHRAGIDQPAPAPRFSGTPPTVTEPVERSLAQQVALWGAAS